MINLFKVGVVFGIINLKIIANGSIRSFEAAYRNAEVYEIFADKYVNQERSPNLNADQKFIEDQIASKQYLRVPCPDYALVPVEVVPADLDNGLLELLALMQV